MFRYYDFKKLLKLEELLAYSRKSRTDDPLMTVDEVLSKHETILDEWCENNLGGKLSENNKYREVVSGESMSDREAFQALLKRIESPKIKAVLVVELQRLGRPDLEEIGKITKIFRYTHTMIITPNRAYDLQDEDDRDSFERELKRGNEYLEYQKKIMSRGRLLSVSQGNYIGSVPPYGYNKVWVVEGKTERPTLAENKEQADVVRMIFDMYVNQNMGVNLIGKHLDNLHIQPPRGEHWSPHTIKGILINVHYIGKVKWNWRKTVTIVEDSEIMKTRPKAKEGDYLVYEGKHSAIITEELFKAAQEKIGKNHRAKVTTKVRNPFASLLYCKCGRAMSLRYYKKNGVDRGFPRLLCDNQVHCNTGSCLYDEMIDMVCDILKEKIGDFEMKMKNDTTDSVKIHNNLIKSLEKKLADLDEKELAQWDAQTDPNSDEKMPPDVFKRLNAKLLKEKDETRKALENAYESMPKPVNYQEQIYKFQEALNSLMDDNVSAEEKNRHLKECIDRIEYYRERPERLRRKPGEKKGSVFNTGASWSTPPVEIDVKLKV